MQLNRSSERNWTFDRIALASELAYDGIAVARREMEAEKFQVGRNEKQFKLEARYETASSTGR